MSFQAFLLFLSKESSSHGSQNPQTDRYGNAHRRLRDPGLADPPAADPAAGGGRLPAALTFAAAVLQGLTVSAGSGLYGILMHFVATGTMCLVAGSIYRAHKTRKMAVVALIIGVLATTAVMAGANMLITPLFLGMPASVVKDLLLPAIIPFNLLKFSINSLVTFLLYKMISRLIHKYDKMAFHKKANQEL
jgi:hypothetical protein